MKKLMMATGCTAMAAIVGCSDAQESAESYGIIGGKDGPTATWMTTQLPWNRFCNRDFLDCVIPAFSITPDMTMGDVAAKLEQTLNTHVANENSVFSRRSWEGFLLRWEKVLIGAKKNPFKIAA